MTEPYVPPPYPYDKLNEFRVHGEKFDGGLIDLSIGSPCDPTLPAASAAMSGFGDEVGYPQSIGTPEFRGAAIDWLERRFDVTVPAGHVAACVGTKEFVASLPGFLKLRTPKRDTILYPAISYPSYAMGADLHGLRSVAVPVDEQWRIRLDAVTPEDAERALCLWVNSPGNPAGGLDDLEACARWGRAHGVPVFSDECYIEFAWEDPYQRRPEGAHPGRSILEHGLDGVVAVHSLSKRSNFAGARAGFYAGDYRLVHFLSEVRKHAGMMMPGPIQRAATKAFMNDEHVDEMRAKYRERLVVVAEALRGVGLDVALPGGGFYLWVKALDGNAWDLTRFLAENAGVLVSPGEFYGPGGRSYVRVAVVQPVERLALIAERLGSAPAF